MNVIMHPATITLALTKIEEWRQQFQNMKDHERVTIQVRDLKLLVDIAVAFFEFKFE